jgi:RNA polymerase sigma-70 factor (ECF subfamily)
LDSLQFEKLIHEHKDSVYRQMIRVCGHREDAEDALASALMLAFQSFSKLQSEEAFRSWLGTIGRRVCTRMRSHAGMQAVLERAADHGILDNKGDEMEFQILKGCVREALDHLRPIYREVYERCELDEKSVPEAAVELGISEAAVKSRLHRARAEVRTQLDASICGA